MYMPSLGIPIYICPILAHTHCEVLWDKNSLLNCVVQNVGRNKDTWNPP